MGLIREKNEASEAARMMEVKMNRTLYLAKLQQKKKCLEVLSQSHSRFSRLLEVFGYRAFDLGWEWALQDPSACDFAGL